MSKSHKDAKGKFVKGVERPQEEKDKVAVAMQGNTNRLKLKTEDLRKTAFEEYCKWVATGKSKNGWVFDYETLDGEKGTITHETLENYLERYPTEFDLSQKRRAENMSFQVWENTGIEMMLGKYEKCQPAIYQMMMRNKFGWDKESKNSVTFEADARKFLKFCESENVEKSA